MRVDAAQASRLRVVANGIDVAADRGLAQHVPGDQIEHEHQHRAVGDGRLADAGTCCPKNVKTSGTLVIVWFLGIDVRNGERDIQRSQASR